MTHPSGWHLHDGHLVREFAFDTFVNALKFVVQVGALAEEAQHHPDIDIRYRKVTLRLFTHDEGAVTAKDDALARAVNALSPA